MIDASPRPEPAEHGPAGPAGRRPRGQRPSGRPPTAADETTLRRLAWDFAQVFLEVEAGCRSRRQVEPLMASDLVTRLSSVWVRPGPPGRVVAVRGSLSAPDRFEAVAVVRRTRRYGALGLRLARTGGGWVVTDASRPEDASLIDALPAAQRTPAR